MMVSDFSQKTKDLIDNLKGTCASYGLGNDGNESKIITQVFLYKFMNDKFGYDLKKIDVRFNVKGSWEKIASELSQDSFNKVVLKLSPSTAKLKKEHLLSYLYNQQNSKNFSKLFDATLIDVSQSNASIFSVSTASNAKIVLFDELSQFVSDPSQRDDFCRAIINQLVNFSFEEIFTQKFDFFSTIFEYLIKDYNKDGGGKYAEYYTPHAVSKIMAKILVDKPVKNVTVYDPSAGSGTLLMNVAHEIGEKNCSIYSQDISQKSSGMLRLNLILNDLVHSIPNVIQGNTLKDPAHKDGKGLKKFDFVVSNPPFKLDFSDIRDDLDIPANKDRFFAGIPTTPKKKLESMPIYLLFVQHIMASLSAKGSAAVVVPTGFLTAQENISLGIRKKLIDEGMLKGVVSMPSNIFATTGTNVSVIFIDNSVKHNESIFVDASNLGTPVKEGKNQKTVLSVEEEDMIIGSFTQKTNTPDFSQLVNRTEIVSKNYSFNPGQYFNLKLASITINHEEFSQVLTDLNNRLLQLNVESSKLAKQVSADIASSITKSGGTK
jgi:type I restriction enzyme M protein